MTRPALTSAAALAALLCLAPPAAAQETAPPSRQELLEELRAMRERLDELEAQAAAAPEDDPAGEGAAADGEPPAADDAEPPPPGATPPLEQDEPVARALLETLREQITVEGTGAAAYVYNLADPRGRKGRNLLRVSDLDHDTFTPTYFKLGVSREVSGEEEWDAGFRVEVAAGTMVEDTLSLDVGFLDGEPINLANAYVEVQLPTPRIPLNVKVGRAYGWFGVESLDLYSSQLYSLSWLANFTPYTNTGLFVEAELLPGLSYMQYVGNGAEVVVDNNDAKTVGGRLAWSTLDAVEVSLHWIWGAEQPDDVSHQRWQIELDVTYRPTDSTTLWLMLHYGQEQGGAVGGGAAKFGGASLAVRQGLLPVAVEEAEDYHRLALIARVTIYRDQGGVNSGLSQTLYEGSLALEVKPTSWSWVRLEYRGDGSNEDFFLGSRGLPTRKRLDTLAVAAGFGF